MAKEQLGVLLNEPDGSPWQFWHPLRPTSKNPGAQRSQRCPVTKRHIWGVNCKMSHYFPYISPGLHLHWPISSHRPSIEPISKNWWVCVQFYRSRLGLVWLYKKNAPLHWHAVHLKCTKTDKKRVKTSNPFWPGCLPFSAVHPFPFPFFSLLATRFYPLIAFLPLST